LKFQLMTEVWPWPMREVRISVFPYATVWRTLKEAGTLGKRYEI